MLIFALLFAAAAVTDVGDHPSYRLNADVITLPRGAAELLNLPNGVTRVAIADSSIANVVVVSPREILINALAIGSTSLIIWDTNEVVRTYTIDVTVDVRALQRRFATLFPGEGIEATAQGNVVVLSGTISGGEIAQRMVEIARGTGATVITNFSCHRPSKSC